MELFGLKSNRYFRPFGIKVLFLKNNLNAQAVASLHDELAFVKADIASLIKEMEVSTAEADAFIKAMANE